MDIKKLLTMFDKLEEKREDAIWEGLLKLSDVESEKLTVKEFLLKVWPDWKQFAETD